MNNLAEMQEAFMNQILDEGAAPPASWEARQRKGLDVYRNNYRTALVNALRDTYERTARWVGEDAFRRAAAHHVISHPPSSWTLDEAGRDFAGTCAALFRNDPEVAELAALEWSMFEIFTTRDEVALDLDDFQTQTADFGEEDWAAMQLEFVPSLRTQAISHDLPAIWNAARGEDVTPGDHVLEAPGALAIWREGERSTFMTIEPAEADAIQLLGHGARYADACACFAQDGPVEEAAMRAGAALGRWIGEGFVTDVKLTRA